MRVTPQQKGRDYEDRLHKEGRAVKQPCSGARYDKKEDLYTDTELIQAKFHEPSKSISIKTEWLEDVVRHAKQLGKIGVVFLYWNFQEWVILRRKDYDALVGWEKK